MPRHSEFEIESVFCKWLGAKARDMAARGEIQIIETKDFPEGAPIHEDGSTEYDPMKPLVLFAVQLNSKAAIQRWNSVVRERNQLINAAT